MKEWSGVKVYFEYSQFSKSVKNKRKKKNKQKCMNDFVNFVLYE